MSLENNCEIKQQLTKYIKDLPKIELHAHLSGSIRESTVVDLIHEHYSPDEVDEQIRVCKLKAGSDDKRDLNECFALFKVLHKIVSSKDILYRITFEVLEDFVFDDKVMYLELRTTPRDIISLVNGVEQITVTAAEYVSTICRAIDDFKAAISYINTYIQTTSPDMMSPSVSTGADSLTPWDTTSGFSRQASELINKFISLKRNAYWFVDASLLLSIDRSKSIQVAEDTLELAVASREKGYPIVGLDFSGNPYSKTFKEFKHIFEQARKRYGFKISIHFAETDDFKDSAEILSFSPDRLGHAAVLNQNVYDSLVNSRIPVEICLTSNAACKLHSSIITHPLLSLHRHRHPVVLCTDDKGVFGASLTDEWLQLLQLAQFNPEAKVCVNSTPHCTSHCPASLKTHTHSGFVPHLSVPEATSSLAASAMYPQSHRVGNTTTLQDAKIALFNLARDMPFTCFTSIANISHMNNILKLFDPCCHRYDCLE